MLQSLFQRGSNPKVDIQITQKKQEFKPRYMENPEITSLTSEKYKLFSNKILKDSSMKYYSTLSGTAKESYETEEIKNIKLIQNMETLPGKDLVIINNNLISFKAKRHFLDLLMDKGLLDKFHIALYEEDHSAPPGKRSLNDGIYEAGGGRRNKKRFTKYVRKRRGKKTRKYKNK